MKRRSISMIGSLLLGLLFLYASSCKHEPEAIPEIPGQNIKPCHPDTVYFQNDILPLLQSSCALSGCHDAITQEDGVNLTNYNSIINTADVRPMQPNNSDLYEVLIEDDLDKRMPPPPKQALTADQIDMVYTWIMQGALNNSCEGGPCDSTNVGFNLNIAPIIQNFCVGCHSGTSPSGGISLVGHSNVVAIASNGKLLGSITHSTGYVAMPQNSNKLSTCQIAQIRKWINDGTPNN